MESLWSDDQARAFVARYADRCSEDLALRVYSARLIGQQPALVLHGGGNTSVKTRTPDDIGHDTEVLCVKGSGWDLGDIEPEGFPAVRLAPLLQLRALESLSDEAMVNAHRTRMLDASGPSPSVETLLHAFLPHKFIDHSHADAILALVDQPEAEALCRERFGERLGIVPYVMPGFELAKLAARIYERHPEVEGLLLLQHGLFTFGKTAKESYERHIQAVTLAEAYAVRRRYWTARDSLPPVEPVSYAQLAPVLRGALSTDDRRCVLHLRRTDAVLDFVSDAKLSSLSQVGPATPDHVIRTKRFPLVLPLVHGQSVEQQRPTILAAIDRYRENYRAYVERQMARTGIMVTPLEPSPRIVLSPGIGLIAVGSSEADASIAADIYEHTIDVICLAEAVDRYQALPEDDIFDMEYWSLEQAKLGRKVSRPLEGHVVIISGAASGIGAATARLFAAQGAALFLLDRQEELLQRLAGQLKAAHSVVDMTHEGAVRAAVQRAVRRFGGVDGIISNAGLAPQEPIASCTTETLRRSFEINLYAHHWLASAASAAMRRQGRGGFLLFNVSKAAFNPGRGFGPYAVPKAALMALVKQYALELGGDGIRANAVNADRVRTGLLDPEEVAARAQARGLDADGYYRANLLRREVSANDVADAFLQLALARSTTGSVVTVDGGNIAASPR